MTEEPDRASADRRTVLKTLGAASLMSAACTGRINRAMAVTPATPKRFDYFKAAKVKGACL